MEYREGMPMKLMNDGAFALYGEHNKDGTINWYDSRDGSSWLVGNAGWEHHPEIKK
jgi:hypothetical protein